jgi:hypothetical protein
VIVRAKLYSRPPAFGTRDSGRPAIPGEADDSATPRSLSPTRASAFGHRIRLKDLLPGAEVELAGGDGDDDFAAHHLPHEVGVGVFFAGAVVVIGDRFTAEAASRAKNRSLKDRRSPAQGAVRRWRTEPWVNGPTNVFAA